MVEADKPQITV